MSIEAFIQFAPEVKGESQKQGFEGAIDVLSWSWGMSQSGSFHMGSGGGKGKVSVNDLSFVHSVDTASPTLLQKCCKGQHFDTATLSFRKASGGDPMVFLTIELKKVLITDISLGGAGDADLTEAVQLHFAEFKYSYTPQDEKGNKKPSIDVTYDIAKGV